MVGGPHVYEQYTYHTKPELAWIELLGIIDQALLIPILL